MDDDVADLRDRIALRALCERYARAVDEGDLASFASVFTPDGHLAVYRGTSPTPDRGAGEFQGREQLVQIPQMVKEMALATFHFVGNHTAEIDGDSATGLTYCTANHLLADRSNLVMIVRYHDRYARDTDRSWRIADRRVVVLWTETHAVDPEVRGISTDDSASPA